MKVFISYSQKDQAAYSSAVVSLEGQRVQCWDSKTMMSGSSLREQLQEAINQCDICVFIATKNSLESKWCSAEIGAFWGIGKRVIVFIAESDVSEKDIPPQFQGDLWTNDIREVVRVVKAEEDALRTNKRKKDDFHPAHLSDLTVSTFYELLSWMRSKSNEDITIMEAVSMLLRAISKAEHPLSKEAKAEIQSRTLRLIDLLIKAPESLVYSSLKEYLTRFSVTTNTGEWIGFGKGPRYMTSVDVYENCIMLKFSKGKVESIVVISSIWEQNGKLSMGEIYGCTDDTEFGDLIGIKW
jgi:hypothetical protein